MGADDPGVRLATVRWDREATVAGIVGETTAVHLRAAAQALRRSRKTRPATHDLSSEMLKLIRGGPSTLKTVRDILKANAYEHVFGYTVMNDVTARDLQRKHVQWFKGKSLDTFAPLGPWIVHRSALPDPHALRIALRVNGETRQASPPPGIRRAG